MADFEIEITFNGTTFDYKDTQHGSSDAHTIHAKKDQSSAQKISWKLKKFGAANSLRVDFPDTKCGKTNGNPFDPSTSTLVAPVDHKTHEGKFATIHNATYGYTVTALAADGSVLHSEDPDIMFDDGTPLPPDQLLGLRGSDPGDLAKVAQTVWEAVFAQLKPVAGLKGEGNGDRLFFPKGITLISVDVEAGPVKVIVKVAGPDAPSGS